MSGGQRLAVAEPLLQQDAAARSRNANYCGRTALLVFFVFVLIVGSAVLSLAIAALQDSGDDDAPEAVLLSSSTTADVEEKGGLATVALQLRHGLSEQCQSALEQYGESITIMVVGETGVGKTSLLANLLDQPLDWPAGERTVGVRVKVVKLSLGGGDWDAPMPFEARLVDSPGWGDTLSLSSTFRIVTRYIDKSYWQHLKGETAIHRRVRPQYESKREHVDVVLYVFSPHRCKGVDMAFLEKLRERVAIVPVLAKADTMTTEELAKFREEVNNKLAEAQVQVAHPPIAVICADPLRLGKGRSYPWGTAESENESHSELPKLRKFLLTDGLLQLKQASQLNYEAFRIRALRGQRLRNVARWATSCMATALLAVWHGVGRSEPKPQRAALPRFPWDRDGG